MFHKTLAFVIFLIPALAFAKGGHHHHAPEIDGGVTILAISLLAGILTLVKKRQK